MILSEIVPQTVTRCAMAEGFFGEIDNCASLLGSHKRQAGLPNGKSKSLIGEISCSVIERALLVLRSHRCNLCFDITPSATFCPTVLNGPISVRVLTSTEPGRHMVLDGPRGERRKMPPFIVVRRSAHDQFGSSVGVRLFATLSKDPVSLSCVTLSTLMSLYKWSRHTAVIRCDAKCDALFRHDRAAPERASS